MKRILLATVLAILLVTAGAFVPRESPVTKATATVHADGGGVCSPATVAGNYGFTLSGTLLLPTGAVPLAAIGRSTLDVEGNGFGTEARNLGGSFANDTFTATYTVSSACTGTGTLKFFESGQLARTSVIATVWDDNANEFRFVQQSLTLPDGTNIPAIVNGEARKISPNSGE